MGWPDGSGGWPGGDIIFGDIIYGINGETRGYILDGVTTLYDTNLIDYNPGVKTWSPIAGASASTGWIADESGTVIFNTEVAHPYAVGDKFSVPYYLQGVTVSSGALLPSGIYTIQSTPTSASFTATPDAGYTIITTGSGSFNGTTTCDIYRVMLPYGMLQTGDRLEVTGNYFASGSGSKTFEIWINNGNSKILSTSTSSNGAGAIIPFSNTITIGIDSITGLVTPYYYLSNEVDNWFILLRTSKVTANDGLALVNFTINLLRN